MTRKVEKSNKLYNICYDIRGKTMTEANKMIENGIDILKLNIGNPAVFDFQTSEDIIKNTISNLRNAQGYSDSKGILTAREAILEYCKIKNIKNIGIDDIYIGNGVSELITMSMQSLLNPGDEILIPSPDYPLWTASVTFSGGTPVHYICDEKSNWYPDIEDIKSKINYNTKGIVIINPNNPTGTVYPKEILKKLIQIAKENDLIIFSDEIYDRLVMDGIKHTSIASLDDELFIVTFNGLSKSHMLAGFRCGWMCLSGDKSKVLDYIDGINLLSSMRLCSNVPSQYAIEIAISQYNTTDELLLPGGRIYEQREFIYNALNNIPGINVYKPQAAFYIFPKLDIKKFNILDDEKFAFDLLREKHILIVQGSGFNWSSPDHFRIVYLPKVEVLQDATNRLSDFLSTYKQN